MHSESAEEERSVNDKKSTTEKESIREKMRLEFQKKDINPVFTICIRSSTRHT